METGARGLIDHGQLENHGSDMDVAPEVNGVSMAMGDKELATRIKSGLDKV